MRMTSRSKVQIEGAYLPLGQQRFSMRLAAGETLESILRRVGFPEGAHLAVQIDGEPVPPEMYARIRPRAGALVTAGPAAGINFVVTAIISIALSFAIGLLLPQPGAPEELNQRRRIEGGNNRARPYEPFPIVHGRIRFAPPIVNPWVPYQAPASGAVRGRTAEQDGQYITLPPGTTLVGTTVTVPGGDPMDVPGAMETPEGRVVIPFGSAGSFGTRGPQKQWTRTLLCWSLGRCDITDIRLDATPALDYGDAVSMATAVGANADFPTATRVVEIGADLNGATSIRRRLGPAETSVTVNFVWPRGLYRSNDKGEIHGFDEPHTNKKPERRWIPMVIKLLAAADDTELAKHTYNAIGGSHETPYHETFTLNIAAAQEVVLVVERQLKARESLRLQDDLTVHSATIPLTLAPVVGHDTTNTSVRVQATDQISGTVPVISGVAHRHIADWDGSDWVVQATRSPASAFRDVLTGMGNARPTPLASVLNDRLVEWHTWCAARGITYDAVHLTRRSVDTILTEIAAAGRAKPAWIDGQKGVIIDRAQPNHSQIFTPANSSGLSAQRNAKTAPHMLRARFRDEDADYAPAEVRVYRPGYTAANATLIEERPLPGMVNRAQVTQELAYQLRAELGRRERYTLNVDWEHLTSRRGDRVGLQHDALQTGSLAGRVTDTHAVAGDALALDVDLDTGHELPAGGNYRAIVRPPSGAPAAYVATPGPSPRIRLRGADALPGASEGDLVTVGQAASGLEDCVIDKIERNRDAGGKLTLSQYGGSAVLDPQAGYSVEYTDAAGLTYGVPFGESYRDRLVNPITVMQTIYNPAGARPARPAGEDIPEGWQTEEPVGGGWQASRTATVYPLIADPAPATYLLGGVAVPIGSEIDFGPWGEVSAFFDVEVTAGFGFFLEVLGQTAIRARVPMEHGPGPEYQFEYDTGRSSSRSWRGRQTTQVNEATLEGFRGNTVVHVRYRHNLGGATAWAVGTMYAAGARITLGGTTYEATRAHESMAGDVADGAPDQGNSTAWREAGAYSGWTTIGTAWTEQHPDSPGTVRNLVLAISEEGTPQVTFDAPAASPRPIHRYVVMLYIGDRQTQILGTEGFDMPDLSLDRTGKRLYLSGNYHAEVRAISLRADDDPASGIDDLSGDWALSDEVSFAGIEGITDASLGEAADESDHISPSRRAVAEALAGLTAGTTESIVPRTTSLEVAIGAVAGADCYDWELRLAGMLAWGSGGTTIVPMQTLPSLDPNTQYEVRVMPVDKPHPPPPPVGITTDDIGELNAAAITVVQTDPYVRNPADDPANPGKKAQLVGGLMDVESLRQTANTFANPNSFWLTYDAQGNYVADARYRTNAALKGMATTRSALWESYDSAPNGSQTLNDGAAFSNFDVLGLVYQGNRRQGTYHTWIAVDDWESGDAVPTRDSRTRTITRVSDSTFSILFTNTLHAIHGYTFDDFDTLYTGRGGAGEGTAGTLAPGMTFSGYDLLLVTGTIVGGMRSQFITPRAIVDGSTVAFNRSGDATSEAFRATGDDSFTWSGGIADINIYGINFATDPVVPGDPIGEKIVKSPLLGTWINAGTVTTPAADGTPGTVDSLALAIPAGGVPTVTFNKPSGFTGQVDRYDVRLFRDGLALPDASLRVTTGIMDAMSVVLPTQSIAGSYHAEVRATATGALTGEWAASAAVEFAG